MRVAVVPERADFVWSDPPQNNFIDNLLFSQLRQLRTNPATLADDHVFVRRAFLDAIGVLPTAVEAREFVADPCTDKRKQLIDRLLWRSEFADHWALKWADLLRVEEKVLDGKGVKVFHAWIRQQIADDVPVNTFVRNLVRAEGSTYKTPPPTIGGPIDRRPCVAKPRRGCSWESDFNVLSVTIILSIDGPKMTTIPGPRSSHNSTMKSSTTNAKTNLTRTDSTANRSSY